MAKTLIESVTYPDVIAPEDGVDPRTAASLEPALQSLVNRTAWLKSYRLRTFQAAESAEDYATSDQSFTTAAWSDVTGSRITVDAKSGDRLLALFNGTVATDNDTDPQLGQIRIADDVALVGSSAIGVSHQGFRIEADANPKTNKVRLPIMGITSFAEDYAGDVLVQLYNETASGSTLHLMGAWQLLAILLKVAP